MTPLTRNAFSNILIGTKLVVLESFENEGVPVSKGDIVTYSGESRMGNVRVNGTKAGWYAERFALANVLASVPPRDELGRFKLKMAAPAPVVAPTPVQAKVRTKPLSIKKGAIYAVKRKRGIQMANLRNVAFGDKLVFSRHGKAFFADRSNVYLADGSDVAEYLAEGKTQKS